jgi:hypothetical protein
MTERDIDRRIFALAGRVRGFFFFEMCDTKKDAIRTALMDAYKMGAIDALIDARTERKDIYVSPAYKDKK